MTNNLFIGGLSNRLAPHLVKSEFALTYINTTHETGELNSELGLTNSGFNSKDYWKYNEKCDSIVSYDENSYFTNMNNDLYSNTDGIIYKEGCNGREELGLPNESEAPTASVLCFDTGNLNGTYRYLYTYYDEEKDYESIPTSLSNEVNTVTDCENDVDSTSTNTELTDREKEDLLFKTHIKRIRKLLLTGVYTTIQNESAIISEILCFGYETFTVPEYILVQNNFNTIIQSFLAVGETYNSVNDYSYDNSDTTNYNMVLPTANADRKIIAYLLNYMYSIEFLLETPYTYKSLYMKVEAALKSGFSQDITELLFFGLLNPRYFYSYYELEDASDTSWRDKLIALGNIGPFHVDVDGLYFYYDNNTYNLYINTEPEDSRLTLHVNILQKARCLLDTDDIKDSIYSDTTITTEDATGKKILLTGLTIRPGLKTRIYRIGGSLNNYVLVDEIEYTSTYIDNKPDNEIINNTILDSFNNYMPPEGGKYLTQSNGMLFIAIDNEIRYCNAFAIDEWVPTNSIKLNNTITGFGVTQNGLLVFTRYTTHILVGNNENVLSLYILDDSQGCIEHNSITTVDGRLVWASTDGICTSTGGAISIITKERLGYIKFENIINAVGYNSMYILATESKFFIIDNRYGLVFRELDINKGYLGIYKDNIYLAMDGLLYELFSGEELELHYLSPIFTHGQLSNYKAAKDVYLSYKGNFIFKVISYNKKISHVVYEEQLPLDEVELNIKLDGRFKHYGLQFEIKGRGTFKEISYNVKDRGKP